jgi:dihydrodipicolinate synthase/N-acetylneuraminate lyase
MQFDKSQLRGVWAAIPLPWKADETLEDGLFTELVHRYKAAGVHGVYTTGTDGEMHMLDFDDFTHMIDVFARAVDAADMPSQAGTTWLHTKGVIQRSRYAESRGITCMQTALPFWVPLSNAEMVRFFAALQEACPNVSIVHYNIANAGRFLTGKDYREILEAAPNLIGSKHTGGNVSSLIEIVQATPELHHFVVDTQIIPGAMFGARGFYSFLVNLNPRFAVQLWEDCERGDWAEATRKRQLVDSLFRDWKAQMGGAITASPAMAKVATAAGIAPEMPLRVRHPYLEGNETHVMALRQLVETRYAELLFS